MISNPLFQGSLVRAGYGALALFAPEMLLKGLMLDDSVLGDQGRYFNRILGGRELVISVASIKALKAGHEKEAVRANAVCAATDLISLAQEVRARGGVDATLLRGIGFNLVSWGFVAGALKTLQP
jgi:hypothetical protein